MAYDNRKHHFNNKAVVLIGSLLRLVFTSDRVGVIRDLKTYWKSRIRVEAETKLDGIEVGRIGMFLFLRIPFTTPSLMIQWKLGCRSWKQKRKNQPIARPGIEHCYWFILPLQLVTLTMQFSLDHEQWSNKQNQCSASYSVGFIFTRSDYNSDYDSIASENQPLSLV